MTDPTPPNVTSPDGVHSARPGYDHDWFDYSPITSREPITWPDGARTAVSVVLHLGAVEWESPQNGEPRAIGGRGPAPAPDFPRMAHREFGHRVGVFRLATQLREHGITPALAVDVLTAEVYDGLVDRLDAAELLAAGLSASRPITAAMSPDEEHDYIAHTVERWRAALGTRPEGWLGPEHSESARTPRLLADAGLRYVADWANDDLPYPAPGAGPGFWHFPLSWELSDQAAAFLRGVSPATWADSVRAAFDVLHAEGGRMLTLHLQPWISGQPYRAESVDHVLSHLANADGVWFASPGEIVAHCRRAAA